MALLEKRRAAWLQQDVDTYLSLFSEDFVSADGVEEINGRAAWEEVVRRSDERASPISWEFQVVAVDSSYILAEYTFTVEPKGTGVTRSVHGMSISEARDGVFTSHRDYRWPVT
jgi:SnoaL-like domain